MSTRFDPPIAWTRPVAAIAVAALAAASAGAPAAHAEPTQPQAALSAAAPKQAFLSILDDVPLPEGLGELPETFAAVEGPEGRILSVQVVGALDPAALTAYYEAALPALGFVRGGQTFVRGRQRLSLTFLRDEAQLLRVTFRLIEHPASLRLG
jgi:hypothetical protein